MKIKETQDLKQKFEELMTIPDEDSSIYTKV
jgi:hypothetical protein